MHELQHCYDDYGDPACYVVTCVYPDDTALHETIFNEEDRVRQERVFVIYAKNETLQSLIQKRFFAFEISLMFSWTP